MCVYVSARVRVCVHLCDHVWARSCTSLKGFPDSPPVTCSSIMSSVEMLRTAAVFKGNNPGQVFCLEYE